MESQRVSLVAMLFCRVVEMNDGRTKTVGLGGLFDAIESADGASDGAVYVAVSGLLKHTELELKVEHLLESGNVDRVETHMVHFIAVGAEHARADSIFPMDRLKFGAGRVRFSLWGDGGMIGQRTLYVLSGS